MLTEIFQEFHQGGLGGQDQPASGKLVFDLPLSIEGDPFIVGVEGLLDANTIEVKLQPPNFSPLIDTGHGIDSFPALRPKEIVDSCYGAFLTATIWLHLPPNGPRKKVAGTVVTACPCNTYSQLAGDGFEPSTSGL